MISIGPSFRNCNGEEKPRGGMIKGKKREGRFAGLERLWLFYSFGGAQRSDILEMLRGVMGKGLECAVDNAGGENGNVSGGISLCLEDAPCSSMS